MPDKVLTLAAIKAAHPCNRDPALFTQLFGDEVEVTYEGIMKVAIQFDWPFAARHLLTEKQNHFFNAICLASFRAIDRQTEDRKTKRQRAMAAAFYRAYNSPET